MRKYIEGIFCRELRVDGLCRADRITEEAQTKLDVVGHVRGKPLDPRWPGSRGGSIASGLDPEDRHPAHDVSPRGPIDIVSVGSRRKQEDPKHLEPDSQPQEGDAREDVGMLSEPTVDAGWTRPALRGFGERARKRGRREEEPEREYDERLARVDR